MTAPVSEEPIDARSDRDVDWILALRAAMTANKIMHDRVPIVAEPRVVAEWLGAVLAGEWQPIDTAPKDTTVILFCDRKGNRWTDCANGPWQHNGCGNPPTHWRHLPHPPETAS